MKVFEGSDLETRKCAIEMARHLSGRSKILNLVPASAAISLVVEDKNTETLPVLQRELLCRAIAESKSRIAAIIFGPSADNPLILKRFVKRVRELASAEGAFFIWDENVSMERIDDLGVSPDFVCHRSGGQANLAWLEARS